MPKPKIYFIKPSSHWNWVDKVLTNLINPVWAGLDKFERSGYKVINRNGCTQEELLNILSRPDTYGIIIASHGNFNGICLDLPSEVQIARERVGTGTMFGDILRPMEINPNRVSPNLQFAVFFGCNITEYTLKQYGNKLGLSREHIYSSGKPGEEEVNFKLGSAIQKAYDGLSVHPRSPDAGIRKPSDAGVPAGVPQQPQASTVPDLSERIKILDDFDLDKQTQVPLQHQASVIPDLSERIRILEVFDEQPNVTSQPQASVIPNLSQKINIEEDFDIDKQTQVPLQHQASVIPDLSERIFEAHVNSYEPPKQHQPEFQPSDSTQWMDQGFGSQVDLRPPSGPMKSPWAQWGLG